MIMLDTSRRGANERAKMPKSWEDDDEEIESAERSHELNMEED
jgi:hypothetical protein